MSSIDVPVLRALLERRSGLDLGRGGMEASLIHFVRQRLTTSGLSFENYLEQVEIPGSEELRLLVEAMTVVYTWFFRDPGQFRVIEQLIDNFSFDRAMGIWVAGCATGEEPYSVALVAAALDRRVDILGTDLNSSALRHAKAGRYASASLGAVDATMRGRYLTGSPEDFVVSEPVKQSVRFQVANLVDAAPRARAAEGWDLVICRNVLIYFGREQARRTLDTLAGSLAPGGTLILGASEAILERPTSLDVVGVKGRAVLRRPRPGDPHPSVRRLSTFGMLPTQPQLGSPPSSAFSPPPRVAPSATIQVARLGSASVEPCTAEPTPKNRPSVQLIASGIAAATTAHSAIEQGHAALDAGNIPTARDNYLRAVNLDPTCAEALMFAGIAHYLDGDLAQAMCQLRGALCLDASLWAACFYQALCYENMGYAEDAARSYSQVIRLAEQPTQRADEHPFLKGWRHDLLAVAGKRANQGTTGRRSSGRMRLRAQNGSR